MITDKIDKYLNEDINKMRVNKALDKATNAFWAVIAKEFREAKSGDLSPQATIKLENAARSAVEEWLRNNT